MTNKAKVCFITAIYGNYELSCKSFVIQTIPTDFICFTDNPNIIANNWIIDTTPYHLINKNPIDTNNYINSITNNTHTFNIAKYYKTSFQCIPRLKEYDVIIWLDGTISIIYDKVSEYILNNIYQYKIIGWNHEFRYGKLIDEVKSSDNINFRYTTTFWNNQNQPYQDINKQYNDYINDGYTDEYFKKINHYSPHFGIWITCFVAFLNNDIDVHNFLKLWYYEILTHTTQDQISFPYVCQKTNLLPLTLPNYEIKGDSPHFNTMFYIKNDHGC